MTHMTPKEIVHELDRFIIGQYKAKRAVAIALRNRWRRMQLDKALRQEISPKNILMIGPTGVGKTEIARRLATLAQAPFIKIEATKFTEVGYVGKEVDSIIRELTDIAIKMVREHQIESIRPRAKELAEERILDALLPPTFTEWQKEKGEAEAPEASSGLRELFRKKLRDGSLDDREISIAIAPNQLGVEIMVTPGMDEVNNQLQALFQNLANRRQKKRTLTVSEAFKFILEEEASKLLNPEEIKQQTIEMVEQNGIVFIDEIDKISKRADSHSTGSDISREGVQRDLLPLVEGCTVSTKHGMVKTDHILFIASGAFQVTSPADLIPELQGRLPIRVELDPLTAEDFQRILTEPKASLTQQYKALLSTEGINALFTEESIKQIAQVAWQVNDRTENIGARRLYTVLERLMEDISFRADELAGETITIDETYVQEHLSELVANQDLSRFVL